MHKGTPVDRDMLLTKPKKDIINHWMMNKNKKQCQELLRELAGNGEPIKTGRHRSHPFGPKFVDDEITQIRRQFVYNVTQKTYRATSIPPRTF